MLKNYKKENVSAFYAFISPVFLMEITGDFRYSISKRKEPPRDNIVEKKIQMLQTDLQRLVTHCELNIKTNLTRKERDAIRDLCSKDDTIITRSDKGSEVVVMENSHLKRLCEEHLADALTYKRLKTNPTNSIRLRVNKTLDEILLRRNFSYTLIHS